MTLRLKILQKIAQTTAEPQNKIVAGEPRMVSISMFPSVNLGWGIGNVAHFQKIINVLNYTMYHLSNGEIDFDKMKQMNQQSFKNDLSSYYADLKKVASLAQIIHNQLLTNNGVAYKTALSPEEKKRRINNIKGDTLFNSISDGGITPTLPNKIGGNFKAVISELLSKIK